MYSKRYFSRDVFRDNPAGFPVGFFIHIKYFAYTLTDFHFPPANLAVIADPYKSKYMPNTIQAAL